MIKYLRKIKLIIKIFFHEKKYINLIKNNSLLYKKKSGKCFILAGGPSLKDVDLNKLRHQNVFAVNTLFNDTRLSANLVSFWTLYDIFLYPFTGESLETVRKLDQYLTPKSKVFVPTQAKYFIDKYDFFEDKEVVYLLFSRGGSTELLDYDNYMDLSKIMLPPHNIVEVAIVCAIYMGFDDIVLLGCDSNWFMYDGLKIEHSYKEDCEILSDDKLELGNKTVSIKPFDMTSMEQKLKYGFLLYKNYRLLNAAANKLGVSICDCTIGGKLDMFRKETLENTLQN